MYLLYDFCLTLGVILGLPFFLVQGVLHKKYFSSFGQRLGFLPSEFLSIPNGGIWIHAVSVGEVLASLPLIESLRRKWPGRPLFVSTTTITGQSLAKRKLSSNTHVFYFPLDWGFAVRKSLDLIRPAIVLIVETEIWPNFLRESNRRKIPVLLVNGRLSDRSVRRYEKVRWFIRRALGHFHYCCMQSEMDLRRILSLGLSPEKAEVSGNLKYEISNSEGVEQKTEDFRQMTGLDTSHFLVIAGSTMKSEEEIVLRAFWALQQRCPQAVLLLAPRHPERFKEVEELLSSQSFRFERRSEMESGLRKDLRLEEEVILLDTMGELAFLYALADVVFIGGSLVPKGGHNILEPALFKKPILFGNHMSNFKEMADHFLRQNAALLVHNKKELADRLIELWQDAPQRARIGEKGYQILLANRGAAQRILKRVEEALAQPH